MLSIWWYWHLSLNTCLTSLSYKIRAINLSPHSGAGLYRVSFIKIVLLTRVDQLYNLYFRICTAQRPWTRSWSSSDFSYFSLWQHSSLHCPVPNLNSGSLAIWLDLEEYSVTATRPAQEALERAVVEDIVPTTSLEVRTSWWAGDLAAPASPRARERPSAGPTGWDPSVLTTPARRGSSLGWWPGRGRNTSGLAGKWEVGASPGRPADLTTASTGPTPAGRKVKHKLSLNVNFL